MIVPEFWAEARLQQPRRKDQKQVTVRRFGWSNRSQAEAEQMAAQRAQEAMRRINTGAALVRLEPKVPYNGATGTPIREEVLSREGDVVITRNSYGAHCLNTPNVLFADIDFENRISGTFVFIHAVGLVLLAAASAAWFRSVGLAIGGAFAVLLFSYPLTALTQRAWQTLRGGPERVGNQRLAAFVASHPEWHLRIYRTPAGLRVLVMHRIFATTEPAVDAFFRALGSDPVYVAMCKSQQCFRARVSPKPWRIGISHHLRPRPGVWPVAPEHLEKRNVWVRQYEEAATRYASCKFLRTLGASTEVPQTTFVRALYDELSRAHSTLEIA